ncbi:peptidyl-prolyl cis-trans isomerase G-like [Ambystoma mexicanum]|uniref:peptidyl-prolyl cis-trans isomerase G-like n=1 Tax=Ambystoma mexicanum TaxID=8296 RepID=UPI0037E7140F
MSAITIALNAFCKLYEAINETVKDQQVTQALIPTKFLHLEGYITPKEDNNINKEMIKQVTSELMDKLKPKINTSLESKNANGCNTKNSITQTKTLIDLTFDNNQSEQSKLPTQCKSPNNNKSSDPQKTPTQRKDSNNKTTSSHLVTAEQKKKEVEKVVLVLNKPTITNKINNKVPVTSYAIFESHNLKEPTNILVTNAKHQRLISNRQLESATPTSSKRHGATSVLSKKESQEGPGAAALADTNLTNSSSEAIISVDNSDLDETLMNLSVHPYDDSNHPSTPLLTKQTKSQNHCSVFEASPKRTNKDNNTAKEHKERDFETLEDKRTRLLNKMQMREHRNSQGQNNNHSRERPSKKEERQAVSNNTDERHKHSNEERRKAQQTRERSRSRNHTPQPNKQHQDSKEKHHHESHHRHGARSLTKPQSEALHLQQNTGRRPSKRRTKLDNNFQTRLTSADDTLPSQKRKNFKCSIKMTQRSNNKDELVLNGRTVLSILHQIGSLRGLKSEDISIVAPWNNRHGAAAILHFKSSGVHKQILRQEHNIYKCGFNVEDVTKYEQQVDMQTHNKNQEGTDRDEQFEFDNNMYNKNKSAKKQKNEHKKENQYNSVEDSNTQDDPVHKREVH